MRERLLTTFVAMATMMLLSAATADAVELQLQNGWGEFPIATSAPEAFLHGDVVYLKGAISGGTNSLAFTLPLEMRPAHDVYVMVDLDQANVGRLWITPSGQVHVQAATDFGHAQDLTSLDGVSFARSAAGFTPLALENDWLGGPVATSDPAARTIDGIVHLKGALSSGTDSGVFTLPQEFRPASPMWIGLGLCNAAKGRIYIQPSGLAQVFPFDSASQCFTSLDGVTYDPSAQGQKTLTLIYGWDGEAYSTSAPAASIIDGVVHLKGGIEGGTLPRSFLLPVEMWPEETVHLPIDLLGGAKGRLTISGGAGSVHALDDFSLAQGFASLDGAKFYARPDRFQPLTLQNDWIGGPFETSQPEVALIDGVVRFRGAIYGGSQSLAFVLPVEMRPSTAMYVTVDMCNATTGRLAIQPSGAVSVQAEDDFSNAQCFTSLDGAHFLHTSTPASNLPLVNGWTDQAYATSPAAAALIRGVVHLRGGLSGGNSSSVFDLPASLRPSASVYLPTSLLNGEKGRMYFDELGPSAVAPYGFDAQEFTSLDGLSFDQGSEGGTVTLPLENGWSGGPFATGTPGVRPVKGIVHLRGGMSGGSSGEAFTLPPWLRPAKRLYVPLDLFNGARGRLVIHPSGVARVESELDFTDAASFTSLDGVTYALPEPSSGTLLASGLMLLGGFAARRGRAA